MESSNQTQIDEVPLWKWDWKQIVRLERIWLRKAQRMPKCSVCGQPMMLGQKVKHDSC
jgi:hypothetical protein